LGERRKRGVKNGRKEGIKLINVRKCEEKERFKPVYALGREEASARRGGLSPSGMLLIEDHEAHRGPWAPGPCF